MEYDGLNRVTKTIGQGPDGDITATTDNLSSIVWFDALGQVTQTQDPAGQQTASAYDRIGRLTRTTEGVDGIARYTDRLYDRAGRLTRLVGYTDGSSGDQATDYAYNKAGVLTRSTYPDDASGGGGDRGYTEYFYDAVLRLTKVSDQEAQDTVIVYDSMSRRTSITKGTEVDSFTYMPWGAISLARRGTSANADATSQSERLYDGLLRLTREAQSVKETAARNVDYAYDDAGNVITLGYPNGAAIATSYTANNLRNVISRGGSQLADYDYVGYRPKSLIYETGANDVTLTNSYDVGGRATRMAWQRSSTDLATFGYNFDAANNITTKTLVHRSSDTEDYAMDTLYRLTRVAYNQRASDPYQGFIYDDLGNRLTLNDNGTNVAGLYNSANELTKLDATQVYYDKTGNVTKDASGNSYFYDRSNKLTRIEDNGSARIASYAYDPFNRRIEKDVEDAGGDIITRFYYTADWRLLEETDDAGTPAVQRYYIWGNYIDELLMFRDVIGTGGSANADYFAARDHLYGVAALIDTSGGVVERYEYDAYGKPHIMDASYAIRSSSTYGNNILFDGYYYDPESGLYCVRERIYDPATMRWFQRDPTGQSHLGSGYHDGMNLYEYIKGDSVGSLDPTGQVRVEIDADAFIPYVSVDRPFPLFGVLLGDARNVQQTPGGSNRISSWITIETDEAISDDPIVLSGSSISPSTLVTADSITTRTGSHMSVEHAVRSGPCTVDMWMVHTGSVPFLFVPIAPSIDYAFRLQIERRGDQIFYQTLPSSGGNRHDGFPAYELFLDNELVYAHDPRITGEGPSSLWGEGEHWPDIRGAYYLK